MASSHIARITAGGVSDRRIAHSLYGYCETPASTAAKVVNLYTGSGTTEDGTWAAADLFHGLTIKVRFKYSNTHSSPTLNVNGTGAKAIYRYGTTKPGTSVIASWAVEEIVSFTYDTLINADGCWVMTRGYRANDNTYDRTRYNVAIQCGDDNIVAANLIVADSNSLYKHLKLGTAFDITHPILYANGDIAADATGTNNYLAIAFNVNTTQSMTLTAYKPVFIKGTLSGTNFTPVSTTSLTQIIPTEADGYQYYLVGSAYSATNIYLAYEHPIFEFSEGSFHLYGGRGRDGVGSYHTTITKTTNSTNSFTIAHYLNTRNVMVSALVNDGTNEYLIQPSTISIDQGIVYCAKVTSSDAVQIIFNPNSSWSALEGTIKITVITTDVFVTDPASAADILIKVN